VAAATPPITVARKYPAALPGSPESTSRTIWTEKVEKVVKPPRKPTPIASRRSRSNQCSATSRPRRKLPDVDPDRRPQERLGVEGEARDAVAGEHAERPADAHEERRHGG
jgi:hypothetical protein